MRSRSSWPLLLFFLFLLACGPGTDETVSLASGAIHARALAPGQRDHRFRFEAPAGRFLHLSVVQREIDVVVLLRDPAGRLLFETDNPSGLKEPEEVLVVTPVAGDYTLIVEPFRAGQGGAFDLKVLELRPAREDDRRRAGVAAAEARAARHRQEGNALRRAGRLTEAAAVLERVVAESRGLNDRIGEARALNSLGQVRRLLGEPRRALEAHRRSLRLFQEAGAISGQAASLNNLALVLEDTGDLQGAIDHYEASLDLWRKLDSKANEAVTLENLGRLYVLIGHDNEGMDLLQQALSLTRDNGSERVSILVEMGWAHFLVGRPERALGYYREAIALAQAQHDPLAEAGAWDRRGSALLALRRFDEARASYSRALAMSRAAKSPKNEGPTLSNLGRLDLETGAVESARKHYQEAADLLAASGDPNGETAARLGICRADRRLGAFEAARQQIEIAVQRVEEMRAGLRGPMSRGAFLATRYLVFEEKVALLMDLHRRDPSAGYDRQALEAAEQARARNLSEKMAERHGFSSLKAAHIQALADEGTLLVVYLLSEPESFAWTVDRDRIVAHVLPAGRGRIEKLARRLVAALSQSRGVAVRNTVETAGRELSSAILAPLGKRLEPRLRLVILADGALHRIPFAALPETAGSETEPLLAEHEIVMLPSATFLAEQRRRLAGRPPARGAVAVLADPVFSAGDRGPAVPVSRKIDLGPFPPLPATAKEAEAILRLVSPQEALLVQKFAASRDLVLSGALGGYRIVHFATHGWVDPVLPERSGLVLSLVDERGRSRNGFLSAPEVAGLKLPAELVVLSACQTGLGRELRGEGLVGLTQAFFQAGARRMVVSYWSVQDQATAELMARFYRGLFAEHLPPAAALRAAQLSIRKEGRWKSPYHWAGFVLHGDWR